MTNKKKAKFGGVTRDARLGLKWTHDLFATVELSVAGMDIEWSREDDAANVWARLPVRGKPDSLEILVNYHLEPGVSLFFIKNKQVVEIKSGEPIRPFHVQVNWREDKPSVVVKKNGVDMNNENFDLILWHKGGEGEAAQMAGVFVHLEVAIVVRNGRSFFLTVQDVYAGKMVRTNVAKAKTYDLAYHELHDGEGMVGMILPLWEHNAYPGNDYVKTPSWGPIAKRMLDIAHARGAVVPLSESNKRDGIQMARWNPPEIGTPSEEGFLRGVCTFFNMAWGGGFLWVPDQGNGTSYFVHFSDVVGTALSLQPMKLYEFKLKDKKGGGQQAADVRLVD